MEEKIIVRPKTTEQRNEIQLDRSKAQLDHIAWLMDECFRIPGVNWRFGLDALIGLIPGAGDVLGGLMGLLLLIRAFQYRLPKVVITRMILNNLIDVTVGAIPLLGDAFDFIWKSNSKNMQLFHEYAGQPEASTTRHWLLIWLLISLFLFVFFLIFAGIIYFASHTIGLRW
jgi:Domain of unknown function (DUF4112)